MATYLEKGVFVYSVRVLPNHVCPKLSKNISENFFLLPKQKI